MDIGKIEQLTNHGEGKVAPKGVVLPLIDPLIDAPRVTLAAPSKIPAPEALRHDWAYAIAPVQHLVFLTGFCKGCQTAITVPLRTGTVPDLITVSKLDIPLYGCEYKSH